METVRQLIQRLQQYDLDKPVEGMLSDGEKEEIHIFESDGTVIIALEPRSFGTFEAYINDNTNKT